MYPREDPEARTPSPSTTVYTAMVSPVARAAPIAAQSGRRPRFEETTFSTQVGVFGEVARGPSGGAGEDDVVHTGAPHGFG